MEFPNSNPVPASLTFEGEDKLSEFCRKRTSNRDDASKLYKLLLPIAFRRKRFTDVIKPLEEAAKKDPLLAESWCASTDRFKESHIYPHIAAHSRCIALATRLNITLELATRVVYKAAFPQMIDFMTVQKLAENRPLMNWLIENTEVTDGHFDRAHARLAEMEPARPAAAAPTMGGAGGPADPNEEFGRYRFTTSFCDPIVFEREMEIADLKAFNRDLNRRLESQNAKSLSIFQTESRAAAARLAEEKAARAKDAAAFEVERAAAAACLAEVEAAAQTRAAADAERIAAFEAAQAAAAAHLAEMEVALAAAKEHNNFLEQQLLNLFWAACEAIKWVSTPSWWR